jgi:glycosyl transferase family WbsX
MRLDSSTEASGTASVDPLLYSSTLRSTASRQPSGRLPRRSPTKAAAQGLAFLDAWNEWAERYHLEPNQKYGSARLNAMSTVTRPCNRPLADRRGPPEESSVLRYESFLGPLLRSTIRREPLRPPLGRLCQSATHCTRPRARAVASRYARPLSRSGSRWLPSAHSFQAFTKTSRSSP